MSKYFVFLKNNIIHEILCTDGKLENEYDIISQMFKDYLILPCDQFEGNPCISGDIFKNKFRLPKPYPSWIWENDEWVAPVKPKKNKHPQIWDEDKKEWIVSTNFHLQPAN